MTYSGLVPASTILTDPHTIGLSHVSDRDMVLATHMDAFINDRTKTFHKKNPYFNTLDLISIIMGGSLPRFQDT